MKRLTIAVLLFAMLGLTACAGLRAGEFNTQKWWADKDRERS
jgi:outer membrane biogenesis lipoprotein LolB